ncbi:MAG TPA: transcriptional regulator GcvA [Candidatus Binatia bacterium]|nr:transcriptional regulator GcvA [Candidatus Binatia bacterium]
MATRAPRLPSLNALKVFWAAARHGSFVKAASELHVTASAVSLQIRQLEDELGQKLFDRTPRGLMLTPAGSRILPDINSAFERLRDTFATLNDSAAGSTMLTVSAAPSFAAKWLLPRLSRFLAAHPDIEVSLKATVELVDFERDEADLGIRYGRGEYADLVIELLMREMVFPVCSPALINGQKRRSTAELLNSVSLLHDDSADQNEALPGWKMWLRAAAIDGVDWQKGPHFNQTVLAIEAAAAGLGVALAPAALVDADLANGRLVRLANAELSEPFAYYLVYPANRRERPAVKAFRDWLFQELAAAEPLPRVLRSSAA